MAEHNRDQAEDLEELEALGTKEAREIAQRALEAVESQVCVRFVAERTVNQAASLTAEDLREVSRRIHEAQLPVREVLMNQETLEEFKRSPVAWIRHVERAGGFTPWTLPFYLTAAMPAGLAMLVARERRREEMEVDAKRRAAFSLEPLEVERLRWTFTAGAADRPRLFGLYHYAAYGDAITARPWVRYRMPRKTKKAIRTWQRRLTGPREQRRIVRAHAWFTRRDREQSTSGGLTNARS